MSATQSHPTILAAERAPEQMRIPAPLRHHKANEVIKHLENSSLNFGKSNLPVYSMHLQTNGCSLTASAGTCNHTVCGVPGEIPQLQ